jgi:hypothetical protein
MGFKRERKGYRLRFADSELQGLEVTASSLNIGRFLDFQAAQARQAQGGEEADGAAGDMLGMFAEALISWNLLDDNDEPVPPTLAGLRQQDLDFGMTLVRSWMDAINGVSDPLPQTSAAGQQSVEASIPMAIPSSSLAS